MNKQEFIIELTKKLDVNADKFYIHAIIDAIRLAHKLDEHIPMPTAGSEINIIDKIITAIRAKFRVIVPRLAEIQIAEFLYSKQALQAIKSYKDASGLGLKECKEDVDKVRHEISFFFEYELEKLKDNG